MSEYGFAMRRPRGRARPKGSVVETSGPSSYPSGGFAVAINDLKYVHWAAATFKGTRATNYVYQLDVSWSNNTVTIKVMEIDVTAATATWAEVASGTDLSGLTFDIIAIGE